MHLIPEWLWQGTAVGIAANVLYGIPVMWLNRVRLRRWWTLHHMEPFDFDRSGLSEEELYEVREANGYEHDLVTDTWYRPRRVKLVKRPRP